MAQVVSAGGNGKDGKVTVLGADNEPVAELVAEENEAVIAVGQNDRPARMSLYDTNQEETIRVTAGDGRLIVGGNGVDSRITARGKDNQPVAELIAHDNAAIIGAGQHGRPARVSLYDTNLKETIRATASDGRIIAGGNGVNSRITARGKDNQPIAELIAHDNAAIIGAGQHGRPARVSLYDTDQKETIRLAATNGVVSLRNPTGQETVQLHAKDANLRVGGNGASANVRLRDATGKETIHLNAKDANLRVGGNGSSGQVFARNKNFQAVAWLRAEDATNGGHMRLLTAQGKETIHLNAKDGTIRAGGSGTHGRYLVRDSTGKVTISLEGGTGDIILFNADLAEEFDVAEGVEPGSVVILDTDGVARCSDEPYDSRVIGVVSGAGSFKPGIVLDRRDSGRPRRPVAVMGKVSCLVDATVAPVRAGDLLTTAERPGHAMRAVDRARAFGAVLGKALYPLDTGVGLVPVLITLQ
jgi:antitoxin (DNA-binding transcriptional repressor) of toxin-antitoxin stability system